MKDEKRVEAVSQNANSDTQKKTIVHFRFAYIDPASMTHTMFFAEDKKVAYDAAGKELDVDVKTLRQENIVPLKD